MTEFEDGTAAVADAPRGSLHSKIIAEIEAKIFGGEWPPGHAFPYEHELTELFGCSRMTVSKALTSWPAPG